VNDLSVEFVVPLEVYVGSDAAVFDLAECRPQRYPAAQYLPVPDAFPQKVHRVAHDLPAGFVPSRLDADAVEEVELDQVEAPIVEDHVEDLK